MDLGALGLGGIFSQVVSAFAPQVRATDPFTNSVIQWAAKLQSHAVGRWKGVAAAGYTCVVKDSSGGHPLCGGPAAGMCQFCRQSTCLRHAAVAPNGSIACIGCLNDLLKAKTQGAPAPPGGDPFAPGDNGAPPGARPADAPPPNRERTTASARKTYLGVMGLKPGATMDDVKKAFRTFSGPQKGHPDKGGDPATYKRWTEAMSWLKKHGVADEDGAGDG